MAWGSDAVAAAVRAVGIEYLALVPGSSFRGLHDSLVNYLGNHRPRLVLCLHEEHAVAIADGYAKATDQPMAVALHANVGLMHAAMSIFNAWCDRSPMLVLGATGPMDADLRRPWIDWTHTSRDLGALVRDYVKWDDQPASVPAAVESILRANQLMRSPPHAPVFVCLDTALQEQALPADLSIPPVARYRPAEPPAVPAATLARITAALDTAERPLLLAGRTSRREDDWQRRVQLAEAIGGAVLTNIHHPAAFPTEHPQHLLPTCGEQMTDDERRLVNSADLIFSLDWLDLAGFLRAATGRSQTQRPLDATVIHCSLDSYLINGWSFDHQALPAVDIPVLASADRLVEQLLQGPQPLRLRPAPVPAAPPAAPPPASPVPGALSMEHLGAELHALAGDPRLTLARVPIGWPREATRFLGPLAYLGKDDGGAVGTGPGHAVGAALALRDSGRLVVSVLGDGDFVMGATALWTAAHLNLALMIVVANNRSYFTDELHQERVAITRGRPVENKSVAQRLDSPPIDLAALAHAQGFDGEGPISDLHALRKALVRGLEVVASGGRYLVDVLIEPGAAPLQPP